MTESTKTTNKNTKASKEDNEDRARTPRKTVYTPVIETKIPEWVREKFRDQGDELRLVRWSLGGLEDYRNLHRRVQEGYDFVTAAELKKIAPQFSATLRDRNVDMAKGICTLGDNCLMKVSAELQQSRREYYQGIAQQELASVDVNVLGKKFGLKDTGSESTVLKRNPSFKN